MKKNEPSNLRWSDSLSALLLIGALMCAAGRLTATKWTTYLSLTQTVAFLGVLSGYALGHSTFSSRRSFVYALAYGLFVVPWQIGRTLEAELPWWERLTILYHRLEIIVFQILRHEAVQDSLLFLVLMATLFWVVSAYAGFILFRRGNAWASILPVGITIFVIHAFDAYVRRHSWYLALFLFFALCILARSTYLHLRARWKSTRTAMPPQLGFEITRIIILGSILLVLLAWSAPALASALPVAEKAWQPIHQYWNQRREDFENIFASLRPNFSLVREFYGRRASLGKGNPLSDVQVFYVRVPPNMPPGLRLYWRARVYDTYANGQWTSTEVLSTAYHPESAPFVFPKEMGRWLGSFEIVTSMRMSTLITPSQPLWVSRPGQMEYFAYAENGQEIIAFKAEPALIPGQTYKTQASVSYPSEARLRQAGEEYPEWITARYLQLPENLTERTRRLAVLITQDYATPYDKAVAITQYLRTHITYVDHIEKDFPEGQEIIDWFLFDLQKGFCNYYATAEVLLLRAVGIPARWAIGYAQGERLEDVNSPAEMDLFEGGRYIIRQKDAHAWPEVYFPGVGWVEFEPTSSQPDIIRLSEEISLTEDARMAENMQEALRQRRLWEEELKNLPNEGEKVSPSSLRKSLLDLLPWMILAGTALLAFFFRKRIASQWPLQPTPILLERAFQQAGITPPKLIRKWAEEAKLPPIARAYQEINLALLRLGATPLPAQTPSERAAQLSTLAPPTTKYAAQLVQEYYIALFSPKPANLATALIAAREIKKLTEVPALRRFQATLKKIIKSRLKQSP